MSDEKSLLDPGIIEEWLAPLVRSNLLSYELLDDGSKRLVDRRKPEGKIKRIQETRLGGDGRSGWRLRYQFSNKLHPREEMALSAFLESSLAEVAKRENRLRSIGAATKSAAEELRFIQQIIAGCWKAGGVEECCGALLDEISDVFSADRASIFLWESGRLRLKAGKGLPPQISGSNTSAPAGQICRRVAETGEPIIADNPEEVPRALQGALLQLGGNVGHAFVSVPLITFDPGRGAQTIGVLNLTGFTDGVSTVRMYRETLSIIANVAASLLRWMQVQAEMRYAQELREEMKLAAGLHRKLLPKRLPIVPGVEISASCEAAAWVGGDYYEAIQDESGALRFAIMDVSGHGIGAALMMSVGRSVLRSLLPSRSSLKRTAQHLNRVVYEDAPEEGMFITGFIGSFRRGVLSYINAGHLPGFLLRRDRTTLKRLEAQDLPFGVSLNKAPTLQRVHIQPGDILLLRTDGIDETASRSGELFGEERVLEILRKEADQGAGAIVGQLCARTRNFADGEESQDDVTVLCVSFRDFI